MTEQKQTKKAQSNRDQQAVPQYGTGPGQMEDPNEVSERNKREREEAEKARLEESIEQGR